MGKYYNPYTHRLRKGDEVWHRRILCRVWDHDITTSSVTVMPLGNDPGSNIRRVRRQHLCLSNTSSRNRVRTFRVAIDHFRPIAIAKHVLLADARHAFYASVGMSMSSGTIYPFLSMIMMCTRVVLCQYVGLDRFRERKKEWIASMYTERICRMWVGHIEQMNVIDGILHRYVACHQQVINHMWRASIHIMRCVASGGVVSRDDADQSVCMLCEEWMRIARHHLRLRHMHISSLFTINVVNPTGILLTPYSAP